MGQSIFEFLFKYRPIVFERGDFTFLAPWTGLVVALVLVVLAVPTVFQYLRVKGKSSLTDRVVLSGLRATVLGLVLFSLFRPILVLSTVVPQRNFVGVLLDDTQSMRIEDADGPRGQFITDQFSAETDNLLSALSERFLVRIFRFSSSTGRVEDATELGFAGGKSDVAQALDHARQQLSSVPLAGLVLVSDGADNSYQSIDETLLALQASSVPVHTVGLGQREYDRDIELTRVETPRRVLNGTSLAVDLMVMNRGFAGRTVPLQVEDAGRIVNTQDVKLGGEGEAVPVRVIFTVTEPGPRIFKFIIPEQQGEIVGENNIQQSLIIVEDRRQKVLYFEGEPRHELAFIQRAVTDDENLQLVSLIRTADNKFFRGGISDPDELIAGFPTTREELFTYQGLVLGSIEASYFTYDQLRMISDFVSERGGGLLILGGRQGFSEGGYLGTPVEDALPVVLKDPVDQDFFTYVSLEVTPAGSRHPVTQFGANVENIIPWAELPQVTVVNPITEIKPGATTLLRGTGGRGADQIVLAAHRFGRGNAMALTVHDSWIWQMDAEVPLEDQTHETFWSQTLRWLVSGVPDRVEVFPSADRTAPGESVELVAEVEDDSYLRVNNTDVEVTILAPSGEETVSNMEWTIDRDGEYRASFVPTEQGLYEISVSAKADDDFIESKRSYVESSDLAREYYESEMRSSLLQRVSDETGGGFYTVADAANLAEDIRYTESGTTVVEERDLWDMPVIFLLVVMLASGEWGYRRFRGLV